VSGLIFFWRNCRRFGCKNVRVVGDLGVLGNLLDSPFLLLFALHVLLIIFFLFFCIFWFVFYQDSDWVHMVCFLSLHCVYMVC